MSRNDVMAVSNNFDYAFDTDLERYIDELPEHREENFRWQMHPLHVHGFLGVIVFFYADNIRQKVPSNPCEF